MASAILTNMESSSLEAEHSKKIKTKYPQAIPLARSISFGGGGAVSSRVAPGCCAVGCPFAHKGRERCLRCWLILLLLPRFRPHAGKPEGKVTDKGKLAARNAGLQRSSSDAGRDRLGDAKKPPSGIARPSTSGSFGYKKPPPATGTATVMQTGGSATLSKIQKSSGIPVKPVNGRKTSLDVSNGPEPGFLAPGARSNIQYRSLPRPAKSSSMSVTGGRGGPRPVSSSIDPSLLSTKQAGLAPSRLKEPSKVASGRATPAPVNQTDREKEKAKAKAVALDADNISLKSIGSPETTPKNQASHPPAKLAEPLPAPARYLHRQRPRPSAPTLLTGPALPGLGAWALLSHLLTVTHSCVCRAACVSHTHVLSALEDSGGPRPGVGCVSRPVTASLGEAQLPDSANGQRGRTPARAPLRPCLPLAARAPLF